MGWESRLSARGTEKTGETPVPHFQPPLRNLKSSWKYGKALGLVYQNAFRFKDDEGLFHILPLSAIGISRPHRVPLRELRDVFPRERKTSSFRSICRPWPARECSDVHHPSDADRSPCPLVALSEYMSAAETALDQLKGSPNGHIARERPNQGSTARHGTNPGKSAPLVMF